MRRIPITLMLGALALGCAEDTAPDGSARITAPQSQISSEVAALSCEQPLTPRFGVVPLTQLRDDEGLVRYRLIDWRFGEGGQGRLLLNEPRTGDVAWFSDDGDGDLVLTMLERGNPDRRSHTTVEIGPRERSEWNEKLRAVFRRIERGCEGPPPRSSVEPRAEAAPQADGLHATARSS